MIFGQQQNWRTSTLPFSLALKNTVNTGVSFDTPSGAIANSQRWASAGFRGFGPVMTFPGAGMDGMGCGCGCGGNGGGDWTGLVCLGLAAAAAFYFLSSRSGIRM
jgi:hypothetical protein